MCVFSLLSVCLPLQVVYGQRQVAEGADLRQLKTPVDCQFQVSLELRRVPSSFRMMNDKMCVCVCVCGR